MRLLAITVGLCACGSMFASEEWSGNAASRDQSVLDQNSYSGGAARAWYRQPQAGPGVTGNNLSNQHPPNSAAVPASSTPAFQAGDREAPPVVVGIARAWYRQPQAGPGVTGTDIDNQNPPNSALVPKAQGEARVASHGRWHSHAAADQG